MRRELLGIEKELKGIRKEISRLGLAPEDRELKRRWDVVVDGWVSYVEWQHKVRGLVSLDQLEEEYRELMRKQEG